MMIQCSDVDIQLQRTTNSRSTSENFAYKSLTIDLNYKNVEFLQHLFNLLEPEFYI